MPTARDGCTCICTSWRFDSLIGTRLLPFVGELLNLQRNPFFSYYDIQLDIELPASSLHVAKVFLKFMKESL